MPREDEIKGMLLSCGADVCGIADIGRFADAPEGYSPTDLYKACKSVLVFGKALPKGLTRVASRLIYGHYNTLICMELDRIALQAAKLLEERYSGMAVPLPCDSPYEYWETDSLTGRGLLSMKHAAHLAGLGEIGKNSLLLNPKYGNLLTIGAILSDLELVPDELCGGICPEKCTSCLTACPVSAIEDRRVDQKRCREAAYGKTARGFDTVDCNRCRIVCPMGYGLQGHS